MIKIDIISGFLGAGKTTFIQKMLNEAFCGEKIAIIENEFGEVGIDGGFLKDAGASITEINSGCICCTLVGDFAKNLTEVIASYHPERIIIEPSGVGKLSDVMKSVTDLGQEGDVALNALVTVVNAKKAVKQMKAFGEFFNNQIEYAAAVVLSRTQDITQEQLELCVSRIKELNRSASVITTPWEHISGEQILKVIEGQDSLKMKMLAEEEAAHGHETCSHEHEEHAGHSGHKHAEHGHEHAEHEHEHGHGHAEHEHGEHCTCGCHDDAHGHHAHHHADEIFQSWGRETPQKYTRDEIETAVKALTEGSGYGEILRAKGMVENTDGGWIYFDMTPGEYEIRQGRPDYTGRFCVIGTALDEHKLEELFRIA